MTGVFYYTDGEGIEHGARCDFFVEKAYREALEYGDKTKLQIAIQHGLPELLEPQYRDSLFLLVDKGGVKKRGFKPLQNRRKDEESNAIWQRVHYWIGRGYPAYDETANQETACTLAAKELHLADSTIRDRYAKLKSEHPYREGQLKIIAWYWQKQGEGDKKTS